LPETERPRQQEQDDAREPTMDLITKSCVKEFLETNEVEGVSESADFEKFASFCVVANEYSGSFEATDILTDDGTQGIDAIAVIVNGRLVNDVDEVRDLLEANGYLEVVFIFVQAKSSTKFEGSEIGNFTFSVKEFFDPESVLHKGERMVAFREIKDFIYEHAHSMSKGNPTCKMFYVTTGNWCDDISLNSVIDRSVLEISATNLFSQVALVPCDAKAVQGYYRKTKEKVRSSFLFEKRVTIPPVRGVKEAYFGMLPFGEFRKLIVDDGGGIRNIFYDNIRDFLGLDASPVNQKIEETLRSGKHDLFGVLNNGITVVADDLKTTGDTFTLTDYQIVNGCQTSHVLFANKDTTGMDNLHVPIRLIVTDDDDIRNEITKATNRQTAVKPEQLEALSQFQKDLEQYYNSVEGEGRLYYERRTNQYANSGKVPRAKIVSIPVQIKAVAAMLLESPHLVSGYYGTIAKRLGESLFREGHRFEPYYASGLGYYRLESMFRSRQLDARYKKLRYHLLMMVRLLCSQESVPRFDRKEVENYCNQLVSLFNDADRFASVVMDAVRIAEGSGVDIMDKSQLKQKEKTTVFLEACRKYVEIEERRAQA
jgi:hypothetical protein